MPSPLSLVARAWDSWRPATCLPDDCFCETLGPGLVRQPVNTWSSLGFVLVAVWLAARARRRQGSGASALSQAETWLLVTSFAVVGLGSAFYHASFTFIGQVVDVSGMYLIATFILLHRLGPKWGISPVACVIAFVVANGALMVAQVTTPALRRVAFGILLFAALVVEWRASRAGRKWLGMGAGLMSIAFLIWGLDRLRLVCSPESLFQGHAIWHLLGALAAACLVRSYDADRLTS